MSEKKQCILYDGKTCDDCGECNMCDLDPKKVCDSCGKCIDSGDDYNIFDVDLIREDDSEPLNYHDEFDESFEIDEEFDDFDFRENDFDDGIDVEDDDLYEEDDDNTWENAFGDFFS